MAEKIVNYTDEQTSTMLEAYLSNPTRETVEMLAEQFGKSVRSIVAKLSREGVYQKAERTTKTGEPVTRKDDLADRLAAVCGLTEAEADSLTKASKTALQKVLAKIG
jgi:response regulator RpfG family c-di-GMP phosphodiesterase